MRTPIKISELQRLAKQGVFGIGNDAVLALLRLARAADRYAWMLSKDGPGENEEHVEDVIVAEWVAARAAFDFGAAPITFDLGIDAVRPIADEEDPDGEGWDMGIVFRCGRILETEDALNSLVRICSEEHRLAWLEQHNFGTEEPSA